MKSQKWKVSSHCRDGKLLFNHLFKRYAPKLSLSGSYLAKEFLFLLFSLYARNRPHSTSNSIGWAYQFFSSFFSFFDFEEDPTFISTSSVYSYRTLVLPKIIQKSSGTLSALPFLVKEREFDKLMQLRISLKAGTKTVTTIFSSFKGWIESG